MALQAAALACRVLAGVWTVLASKQPLSPPTELNPPSAPSLAAAAEASAQPLPLPQVDPAALLEQLAGRDAVLPEILLEVRHNCVGT